MWVGYMHQSQLYGDPCEFLCGIALHHTMETPRSNLLWMELSDWSTSRFVPLLTPARDMPRKAAKMAQLD